MSRDLEWVLRLVVGDLMYLFDQGDFENFGILRKEYRELINQYYLEKRVYERGDGTAQ